MYKVYTYIVLIDCLSRAYRNTIVMLIYRIKDSPKFLSRGRRTALVKRECTTTNNMAHDHTKMAQKSDNMNYELKMTCIIILLYKIHK